LADYSAVARAQSEQTDEQLLAEVAAGSRAAFKRLADCHTARLLRLAWRYSGNAASAEDIVQEALLRIWQRAGQWDEGRGSGKSWIDRIVINLCLDLKRRAVQTVDLAEIEERPGVGPDPHESVAGVQFARAIAEAIQNLPERQRAALALCFGTETSCAEGAKILGVSIPTMESLLLRGRKSVRHRLAALGFIEER
jgi:RNA polymerase sigma-70 factor (ECF subfamily)